jgi:hypothetical protein
MTSPEQEHRSPIVMRLMVAGLSKSTSLAVAQKLGCWKDVQLPSSVALEQRGLRISDWVAPPVFAPHPIQRVESFS